MAPRVKTEELLVQLGKGRDFLDPTLPKGTFSHSQYTKFKMCPKMYEFQYVQQVPQPGFAATTRGSAVHSAVEVALKKKLKGEPLPGIDAAKEVVGLEFDARAKDVVDWGDTSPDLAKKEALELYEAFHVKALPKIKPQAIEKPFAVKFGGVPFIGFIDLIDQQPAVDTTGMSATDAELAPQKKIVVDFKTAKTKWSDKDVRLDTQLTLYSAVEGVPNVAIDQLIPYKKGAGYVRAESIRTKDDIAVLEEDVAETAQLIRQGIFPKTSIDSWACNAKFCSYWSLCRGRTRN